MEFCRVLRKVRAARTKILDQPATDEFPVLANVSQLPFLSGNDVELLVDGEATFASIFEGISRAEKVLLLQFYIIHDDELGREFARRLIERAQAGVKVDRAYQIPDSEALPYLFDLLEHEGLCLGGSSAINIAGAVRLARDLGPGKTIVTVLADYGNRYQSKLFNPAFLSSKGLPVPHWLKDRQPIDWQSVVEPDPA
jgi:phosphatidylserine/phosphatidylglycerophosphate/cardiolipin synthase-like enzyme